MKSPDDKPAVAAWVTLGILVLLAVVSYLDRAIISLMVDPIKHDLRITDFQMSLLQGLSFAIFFAVFGVFMGSLVDRLSRRRIIFAGVTLWSIATAAAGLARTFSNLFLARMAVGVGEAALNPSSFSVIADLFPRRRLGLATSIFTMGAVLGTAAAIGGGGLLVSWATEVGPVTLPLVGALHPWQLAFVVAGVPGLVLAPLIFLVPEPRRRDHAPDAGANIADLLRFMVARKAYFASHFLGFGTIALLGVGLNAWFPAYLIRHYDLPVRQVGLMVGLITAGAGALGFLFAGASVDFWFARGVRYAHFAYSIVAALGIAILGALAFSVGDLTLCLWLYGGIAFLTPVSGAAVAHLQITTPSQFRGRVSALFLLVHGLLGAGAGPSVVAAFTDFMFHDPKLVGRALFMTFVIFAPLSALILSLGLKAARIAAERAETPAPSAWDQASERLL